MARWTNYQDQQAYRRWQAAMNPPVTLNLRIIRQTEKAVLVQLNDASEAAWLPKSQIKISEPTNGVVVVTMPAWLERKVREQLKGITI